MKKNIKSSKGFTLIELLAVIVILGILMMTAIPAVTRSIAKSRRNTYWQNAKSYVKAATTPYLDGEYNDAAATTETCPLPGVGEFVVIPQSIVELEQGDITKSSFNSKYVTSSDTTNKFCEPTIVVANIGSEGKDNLQWYYIGMDKSKNGITDLTNINDLKLSVVKTGAACKKDSAWYGSSSNTLTFGSNTVKWKATCTQ